MNLPYPRWIMVSFSVVLTLLTGALATAQLLNGVMIYENPEAMRDGQYSMTFGIGSAVGCITAIPAAVMAGIFVARRVEFAPVLNWTLLACLLIGIGIGIFLAWAGGGVNGLGWAMIGIMLSGLGIVFAPMALFVLPQTLPVSAPVGIVLFLAVLGARWYYRRTKPSAA